MPIIIPIVFYHGEGKWNHPKTIGDWIDGYKQFPKSIQKNVPNYDFILFDFSFNGGLEIRGGPKLRAFLELSKHIFIKDPESLIVVFVMLENTLSEHNLAYLDTAILYLLSARDDVPIETLKEKLTIEGRKRLMSIAEQLEKRGEMEAKKEVAKKLLLLNMEEKEIMEVTNLTKEDIEHIKKRLK